MDEKSTDDLMETVQMLPQKSIPLLFIINQGNSLITDCYMDYVQPLLQVFPMQLCQNYTRN